MSDIKYATGLSGSNSSLSLYSRYFGYDINALSQQDLYLNGFIFTKYYLPPALTDVFKQYGEAGIFQKDSQTVLKDVETILSQSTQAINPPGANINTQIFNGIGGRRWVIPTTIEVGTQMTLKHFEFSGLPITKIYNAWFRFLRDSKFNMGGTSKNYFSRSKYTQKLLTFMTDPSGQTIEKQYLYMGVYPMKDSMDVFVSDIQVNDTIDITMDVSCDVIFDGNVFKDIMDLQNYELRQLTPFINNTLALSNGNSVLVSNQLNDKMSKFQNYL